MIKIRLHGAPEECRAMAVWISQAKDLRVMSVATHTTTAERASMSGSTATQNSGRPSMEGIIRRSKTRRFEIVPKGEKRGQLLCSGDDIDIKINGIWLPTRIAYADDKGG